MSRLLRELLNENDLDLSPAQDIPPAGMAVAAVPILTVALVSLYLKLGNVQNLLISASRCVVQLLLLGLILVPVFKANRVYVVLPYILVMMLLATREASLKPKLSYVGMRLDMFVSIITSVTLWLTVMMFGVLRPTPWYNAQVVIPTAGMMLGSCVNALSLGVDRFLSSLRGESGNGSALVQTYLNCGASKWEMSLNSIRQAIETGLTPNLNQMSVMGLVSIPGMLTGQILGGTSPFVAAKYQIVIMFFVCSNSTVILLLTVVQAVFFRLFDNHMFHSGVIQERKGGKPKDWVTALCTKIVELLQRLNPIKKRAANKEDTIHSDEGVDCSSLKEEDETDSSPGTFCKAPSVSDSPGALNRDESCLLKLSNGSISHGGRSLLIDLNFSLGECDIVMVTGPSGCGKSTLLQSLALLEPLSKGILSFRGREDKILATVWRCEVLYVRQSGGQGLPGTPRELLLNLLKLQSQSMQRQQEEDDDIEEEADRLVKYLQSLDLPTDMIDARWDRLSGGEAQRVYLCVMLALHPSVLLLDEPTSACDEQAARKVEDLIVHSGIAVLWVSHDPAQMERLEQFDQTSYLQYQQQTVL